MPNVLGRHGPEGHIAYMDNPLTSKIDGAREASEAVGATVRHCLLTLIDDGALQECLKHIGSRVRTIAPEP